MAVGIGYLFGIKLDLNFKTPYLSANATEFWKRWHITLSSWMRNYLYIPLGGNRRGRGRTYFNLLVVWLLTGLWHGASWNFVLWGGYYALLLMLEKAFLLKILESLPRWAGNVYAIEMILLGLVLFSFEDLGKCLGYMGVMLGGASSFADPRALYALLTWLPMLIVAAFAATPLPARLFNRFSGRWTGWVVPAACMAALLLCTAYLVDASYNPFLYFRF
jgi:alginate O-acetyltransferase complex protein AlgI